ncbi:MAG TPA: gliding motility-associated ABC transporter substrate-binding protein GldG [Cyclobacteriaceae bacterium]|nr:gliding motility-associated ABC transporter substrate-binding protein GldG [Cyclobacteriaceae bacterium]
MKKSNRKNLAIVVVLAASIGFLYVVESFFPFRIDLTEEKRYSLHPATAQLLSELQEPLEVEILLTGTLPGGMRRLQKSIEETLRTFDAYSPHKISYYHLDPLALDQEEQQEYIYTLAGYGINPTDLFVSQSGGQTSRRIFPGVVVRNEEFEVGTLLLKGERGMSPEEILNQSIENLEFELSNAIKRLVLQQKSAVGIIISHGEMDEDDGFGMVEALVEDYEVYKVPMEQAKSVEDLLGFEALIVAGPKEEYTDRERYLLDQYLMNGGNLLFFIDQMAVDLRSADGEGTVSMPFDTGLNELLFRYGIRINRDLIQDLNFGYHPVVAGDFGNQSQIVPLPWPFYIMAGRMADHPITKGLDQLQFSFASTLDTVKADGVIKTPLVFTSDYTRKLDAPVRIAFSDMSKEPDIRQFQMKNLPLLYLLEGTFTSFYKNRFIPDGFDKASFLESGNQGRVLVAGDGDFIKSKKDLSTGDPLPLGEDPFAEGLLANRIFIQNAINYLLEPQGIISTRTKQYKIRPLDAVKIKEQRTYYYLLNLGFPIAFIMIAGFVKVYWRKRKFADNSDR